MPSLDAALAGTLPLAGHQVPRIGYGAMRLPGPRVWGPPADRDEAIAVLRRAVELGVRVIDTAWYYGLDVANELIAAALRPYPEDLVLVTKLGGTRHDDASWHPGLDDASLRAGCERDLTVLGLDTVAVVHLRWIDQPSETGGVDFADALGTLLDLRKEGKIGQIGLSNVSLAQLEQALTMTEVATVSNMYGPTQRADQPVLDRCTAARIPYLPYFPLAMGHVAKDAALATVAARHAATATQVAIAWLLQRSPIMLPIPGTSRVAHLDENVAAAALRLTADDLALLDA